MTNKTKAKKYFVAREVQGKTQAESLLAGEMNPAQAHGTRVEESDTYAKLKEKYADVLKSEITFKELAEIQVRNATQDKDKGASNVATENILKRVAPMDDGSIEASDVIIKVSKE